ncbi:hypothetical protein [Rubrolithibacter danxiaensis]|uniref:hypothetical protein n=1 Tax=Rubrolithibacter danxiaensis TaxID=3390805 RepID=UPI003BF8974B
MENTVKKSNSLYFILALIFGILTAYVVTDSFVWAIAGAVLGLLTAGFYVNVLAKDREV